ncbi:MAG: lamin tail domain-containing protein, partial [Candidatus Omnitrophica bacterium]|nr:lamin tail domain-containing protein [Candidatus Omnitrophota bacterium]
MWRLLLIVSAVFILISANGPAVAEVVLNEIAYHPITDSSAEEYIEIYNTGSTPVDLSGWALEGVGYIFPASTTISAHGYRVIAKNPTALSAVYPGLSSLLGPYPGLLQNSGERVRLLDASEQIIDLVEPRDALPWPTAADGRGPSLELRNPELDNAAPEAWAASDLTGDASAAWQIIDVTFTAVAGDFFFYLADQDGNGWIGDGLSIHILFDDFFLSNLSAPGTNLISDGGFESGVASAWNVIGPL